VFTELRIVDLLIDLQMSTGATTSPAPKRLETASTQDPLWYKDAIIYQAHVRAFLDTSNDGVGDFRGLTEKLDYLEALGIDTIWLLPFYPSPLRDDGYDIADYENINPAYGTLADFDRFIEEAHRRKLRVITELVITHRAFPSSSPIRRSRTGRGTTPQAPITGTGSSIINPT
jgi:1,4-alpha-glucan branching enzyme